MANGFVCITVKVNSIYNITMIINSSACQVWNSNTGVVQSVFNTATIIDPKKDNILCINLSADNKRLVASATNGLVVVCLAQ